MIEEITRHIISESGSIFVLFVLFAYWIYDSMKQYQEKGFSQGVKFSIITLAFLVFAYVIFIIFPVFLKLSLLKKPENEQDFMNIMTITTVRWFFLYAILCPLALWMGKNIKTCITMLVHLSVFLVGWMFGNWFGMFFVSLPILVVFYLATYHLAQAIYPVADPEATIEKRNKFTAFFWYIWGMQYRSWVARSSATRYSDKRIDGNYIKPFGGPGIIWTYSHQAVARSIGIELVRVDGPGILFTGRSERPVALVDLRTQLRPTPFTAVTKDGIEIKAYIFISFQIDGSDWEREKKHEFWRMNPVLQKGMEIEKSPYISHPYSRARVHATLSSSSIDFWGNDNKKEERYWDDVAVQRVLKEARLALSERTFDELWAPVENDSRGTGAIDEVSTEIVDRAKPELEKMGVTLFGSRIVNFVIDEDSSIYKQLKKSWLFAWDRKIAKIKFEGVSEAEKLKIDATMSSRMIFMETMTETLRRAQDIDNNLLRQLTTLNFIATLEKLIEDVDKEENAEQQTARISAWGRFNSRSSRDR